MYPLTHHRVLRLLAPPALAPELDAPRLPTGAAPRARPLGAALPLML